jgi:hypothetical protein
MNKQEENKRTEVCDFGVECRGDEDVAGGHVAVDDRGRLAVQVSQTVGGVTGNLRGGKEGEERKEHRDNGKRSEEERRGGRGRQKRRETKNSQTEAKRNRKKKEPGG